MMFQNFVPGSTHHNHYSNQPSNSLHHLHHHPSSSSSSNGHHPSPHHHHHHHPLNPNQQEAAYLQAMYSSAAHTQHSAASHYHNSLDSDIGSNNPNEVQNHSARSSPSSPPLSSSTNCTNWNQSENNNGINSGSETPSSPPTPNYSIADNNHRSNRLPSFQVPNGSSLPSLSSMVGFGGSRTSPSQQVTSNALAQFKSSGSPLPPAPGGGPTPDHYFRNVAAMSGLNPYSYEAAAAAAACAWAGRLGHHQQHPSSLSRSNSDVAAAAAGFNAGLTAAASSAVAAFRRSGKIITILFKILTFDTLVLK